jgi:hypothetical protein
MKESTKLIRVYSGTEVTVNLLKDELESIGISSRLQNDFKSGTSAGFSGGVPSAIDLYIQEIDFVKAEPIIKQFIQRNKK